MTLQLQNQHQYNLRFCRESKPSSATAASVPRMRRASGSYWYWYLPATARRRCSACLNIRTCFSREPYREIVNLLASMPNSSVATPQHQAPQLCICWTKLGVLCCVCACGTGLKAASIRRRRAYRSRSSGPTHTCGRSTAHTASYFVHRFFRSAAPCTALAARHRPARRPPPGACAAADKNRHTMV